MFEVARDFGEGEPEFLCGHHKRQPSDVVSPVPAVPACVAQGCHDPVVFIEPDCRDGESGAGGDIADGEAGHEETP